MFSSECYVQAFSAAGRMCLIMPFCIFALDVEATSPPRSWASCRGPESHNVEASQQASGRFFENAMRPGYLSPSAGLKFADIPNGLAAISKVPTVGWAQIAAYFGFVEFSGGFDDYKTGTPGDYGFKVLTSSDPAEKTKKLSAELANGRLAMMAIIGMFFQDKMPWDFCDVMSLLSDSHMLRPFS